MMSMSTPFQGIQSAVKKSIDQDFLESSSTVRRRPYVRTHLPVWLQVHPEKRFRLTKRQVHANFTLHLRFLYVGF